MTTTTTPSLTLGTSHPFIFYHPRTAVRCLILNSDKKLCLIHVQKGNYHKLPGGGVESEDPDHSVACKREALEETGCEVLVESDCFARTVEFRGDLRQESFAYICTVLKDTGKVELTELEKSEGLVHFWVGIQEALGKMKGVEPSSELGEFIQRRDGYLLETFLRGL